MQLRHSLKSILITMFAVLIAFGVDLFLPKWFTLAQTRTWAVFTFAVIMWSTSAIANYATSLLVVIALTFCLIYSPGVLPNETFKTFLIPFSSPVMMLFFGGFILAKAITKHSVDQFLLQSVFRHIGRNPSRILLGFIGSTAFLSMWISNSATAAIMLVLAKPFLDSLEHDNPYQKGLVLAIVYAASIGGVMTPVGTPPNAIAIGILSEHGMHLNFVGWMVMTFPVCLILLMITWYMLKKLYPSSEHALNMSFSVETTLSSNAVLTLLIGVMMIMGWVTTYFHHIPEAMVALMGVGTLSALGVVNKDDIASINWSVLILIWGGLALGQAMQLSDAVGPLLSQRFIAGHDLLITSSFCIIAVVLSTFINNTTAANIMLPLLIGMSNLDQLVITLATSLMCSLAFALPISNIPNAMAYSLGIVTTKDFLKTGLILSIVSLIIILIAYEGMVEMAFPDLFHYLNIQASR